MNRMGKHVFAWLLCLALVFALAVPAFAEELSTNLSTEFSTASEPAAPVFEGSILDSAAIEKMVDDYLARKGIGKDRVGIGFCYTATGDEWFLNPDTWFYPGSMYKVPLMMILSERLRDGQIGEDTQIGGLDLDTVYNYILVHSNNDYAHAVRKFLIDYLGGNDDEIWRKEAQQYARLDLLQAEQGHYFRLPDEMRSYDVAQKYGSYIDNENTNWNHTTGIIYTSNPFIITVMTKNVGGSEQVIADLGVLFKDYALGLDAELEAFRAEQAKAEQERLAAEEAERLAAEQALEPQQTQTQPGSQQQSASRPNGPETLLQTKTPDRAERGNRALIKVLLILLIAAILGGIASVIIIKENERRRYESYKRRFAEEMRREALEREQARQPQERPAARQPERPAARPAQPEARPRAAAQAPAQRPSRPAPAPAQAQRRAEAPIRPQPRQSEPVTFDEDQWLHDEEDE